MNATIKKTLLIASLFIGATLNAEYVDVSFPEIWENAPTSIWNATNFAANVSSENPEFYVEQDDGTYKIEGMYNIGGYTVTLSEAYYETKDIIESWFYMSAGTLSTCVRYTSVTDCYTSTYENDIRIRDYSLGGDIYYYITDEASISGNLNGGSNLTFTHYVTPKYENGTLEITDIANIEGDVNIYADDDTSLGQVAGGGSVTFTPTIKAGDYSYTGTLTAQANVLGDVNITIDGSTVSNYFIGGGIIYKYTYTDYNDGEDDITFIAQANVLEDVNITILDGTFESYIFGGGFNAATTGGNADIGGDVNIDISGGTFNSSIYGGGYSASSNASATVYGNVNIDISGGVFNGNVVASGLSCAIVEGNATINISGDAQFSASSKIIGQSSSSSVINGTISLNFDDYDNSSSESVLLVSNFDKITVTNNSDVAFGNYVASDSYLMKVLVSGGSNVEISDIDQSNLVREESLTGNNMALIRNTDGSTLTVSSSNFENNSSTSTNTSDGLYGNVISTYSSDLNIYNSDFINNISTSSKTVQSSAVWSYGEATTTITNSNFEENKTVSTGVNAVGSAVTSFGSNLNISDSNFSNNTAEANYNSGYASGGAVYAEGADWGGYTPVSVKIENSIFDSNSVTGIMASGGALSLVSTNQLGTGDSQVNDLMAVLTDVVFTNNSVNVDSSYYQGGGAVFSQGATIEFVITKDTTYVGNVVNIDSVADDASGGFLFLESYYQDTLTTFNISEGATLTIGQSGKSGYDSIANSLDGIYENIINKTGAGTLTVNSSMEFFYGKLNVNAGTMELNNVLGASTISILGGATLSATISDNYIFTNESLTVSNAGTFNIIAGIDAEGSYTISANTDLDFDSDSIGAIAYGGTINDNTFIVSAATSTDMTTETTVIDNGRIVVDTSSSSSSVESVVMSFNASTATLTSVTDVSSSLGDAIIVSESSSITVLAAFDFDITLTTGDSVVLSFLVGDGYNLSDFTVYHSTDNESWDVASEISDLTYDGEYLSFIVTSFSAYGVAVPEPSTYAMIFGALALGLAVYRRRK